VAAGDAALGPKAVAAKPSSLKEDDGVSAETEQAA